MSDNDEEPLDPENELGGLFVDDDVEIGTPEDTDVEDEDDSDEYDSGNVEVAPSEMDASVDIEPDEADVTDLSMVADEAVPEDTTSAETEDDASDSERHGDGDTVNDDGADADNDSDEGKRWVGDAPEWQQEAAEELDDLIESVDADDTDNPSAHAAHAWSLVEKLTEVQLGIRIDDIVEILDAIADEDVTQDDVKSRRGSAAATRDTLDDLVSQVEEERTPDPDAIWESAGEVCDEYFEEQVDRVVYALNTLEDTFVGEERVRTHRRLVEQAEQSQVFVAGGRTWVTERSDNGEMRKHELLNFELEVESLLSVEGEGTMAQIEARPSEPSEPAVEMQIEPRVFNDARRFKDEVLAKRFSTTIEADMRESDVMNLIRKYISSQDVPRLAGQKSMGLARNGNEFVTPNGVIGVDGWADDQETVFVEQDAASEGKFAANPDDHSEAVNDDVAEMLELFTRTRDPERFVPVLGWWFAAPHRERIVDTSGSMNLLFITGESGVGKSGSLKVLNRMFGMEEEPFSATDTKFANIKTFASSSGVPVWLDEYKTSEMADWKQDGLHELLRKVATGGVEQRGRADQSTVEYHLTAPVCVSGETSLRGSAEQRRAISTTFTNAPTVSGTPEYQRFKELAGDAVTDEDGNVTFPDVKYELEQHAVKYYEYVASMTDEEFENKWFAAREYVSAKLAEWDTNLDDLEVQGLQTVCFGFRVLREFGEEVGADLSKLPGEDDLDASLRYVADVEGDGRETHTDQFVQLVQRAVVAEYLERGTHYDVVREGKAGEELRVNVNRSFDAVSKYVRDHDLSEDLLGSAKDYNDRFGEAEDQDTYVVTTSQPTTGIGRCVGIHTETAAAEITSFERGVFVDGGEAGGDREGIEIADVAGVRPSLLTLTGERVDVVNAGVGEWMPSDTDVHAFGAVRDRYDEAVMDLVAFEKPKNSEDIEAGCEVEIRGAVLDTYEGELQLQMDEDTVVHVVEETDGDQETVNDSDDAGECENTTPGASEDAQAGEAGVRADGSGDVMKDGFVSQDARVTGLKEIIEDLEDDVGAAWDAVVEDAVDAGISEDKLEHERKKLARKGEIYEPCEGYWRTA